GAASWTRLGVGLPNVQVVDLQYNPTFGVIAAATQGRGVFTLSVDQQGPVVTNLAAGSTTASMTAVNITFNEPVATASIALSEITITDPSGNAVTPTAVNDLDPTTHQTFQVTFAAQTALGFYTVK